MKNIDTKKLENAYEIFIKDLESIIENENEKIFNYIKNIENEALELYDKIERS